MDMEDEQNNDGLSGLQEKKPDNIIPPPVGNEAPGGMVGFYYFQISNCIFWALSSFSITYKFEFKLVLCL